MFWNKAQTQTNANAVNTEKDKYNDEHKRDDAQFFFYIREGRIYVDVWWKTPPNEKLMNDIAGALVNLSTGGLAQMITGRMADFDSSPNREVSIKIKQLAVQKADEMLQQAKFEHNQRRKFPVLCPSEVFNRRGQREE